ncbi:hypothetical protein [Paenibacillus turpanensis]|uniref:hypothetical protein n=1 Tax=Paenibacillus turpanensis TaxID=2689078 RepID=UPI00140E5F9C|nr:hypothetical protein [Paenibacillus turpanensis]
MGRQRLLIKHAVGGRTFVDSVRDGVTFTLEQKDGGWLITVRAEELPQLSEMVRLQTELNVFIFDEEAGKAVRKTWYYVREEGVSVNGGDGVLQLFADSRIEYDPDGMMG